MRQNYSSVCGVYDYDFRVDAIAINMDFRHETGVFSIDILPTGKKTCARVIVLIKTSSRKFEITHQHHTLVNITIKLR